MGKSKSRGLSRDELLAARHPNAGPRKPLLRHPILKSWRVPSSVNGKVVYRAMQSILDERNQEDIEWARQQGKAQARRAKAAGATKRDVIADRDRKLAEYAKSCLHHRPTMTLRDIAIEARRKGFYTAPTIEAVKQKIRRLLPGSKFPR